jgi:hypothetical protein
MIMYHGTYGMAAKNMAKEGIKAKPPDRNYSEDDPDNYHIASLDGAYFTNQLHVAVGYAFKASETRGDWCAVITANVPLTKAVPDEDVVTSALQQAERETRDPDAFARAFHRNLVQDRPIPIRSDLMVKVRNAFAQLEAAEDDKSLLKSVRRYRQALDQMTRAYAAMVFDTHPVYLGGNHTVRLPRGLSPTNILSITQFSINFPQEDDGGDYGADYPQAKHVMALLGQPFSREQLQDAIDELYQQDFF